MRYLALAMPSVPVSRGACGCARPANRQHTPDRHTESRLVARQRQLVCSSSTGSGSSEGLTAREMKRLLIMQARRRSATLLSPIDASSLSHAPIFDTGCRCIGLLRQSLNRGRLEKCAGSVSASTNERGARACGACACICAACACAASACATRACKRGHVDGERTSALETRLHLFLPFFLLKRCLLDLDFQP